MRPTSRDRLIARARDAALTVAGEQGLSVDSAELLVFASNVLFHLHPQNLVARVTGEAALIRPVEAGRQREIDVTRFLCAAGAPAVPPAAGIDAGPHHSDGLTVTFWTYVEDTESQKSWVDALATLRDCREVLGAYPDRLPALQGYNETRVLFDTLWRDGSLGVIDPAAVVQRLTKIDAVLKERQSAGRVADVPLHGDAHLRNMLVPQHACGQAGLWIDWDDVCTGPVEWDYACLIVSLRDDESRAGEDRMLMDAIATEVDTDCLAAMIDARNLQRELWETAIKALNKSDVTASGLLRRGVGRLRRALQRS